MGIDCRILPTSTRNLRQTKAEMRRELEELKWGLRHSQDPNHIPPVPPTVANIAPIEGPNHSPIAPGSAAYSVSGRTDGSVSMSPQFQPGAPLPGAGSRPGTRNGSLPASSNGTLPRVLEDFVVDGKKIDDTFTLYLPLAAKGMD